MTKIKSVEVIKDSDYNETAKLDVTRISYCQSCSNDFKDFEVVFYAPIDNNIICRDCIDEHLEVEPRLYLNK